MDVASRSLTVASPNTAGTLYFSNHFNKFREVLRRRLRFRGRGQNNPHHFEPVPVCEVPEAVVGGHKKPLGIWNGSDLILRPFVQLIQLSVVFGSV